MVIASVGSMNSRVVNMTCPPLRGKSGKISLMTTSSVLSKRSSHFDLFSSQERTHPTISSSEASFTLSSPNPMLIASLRNESIIFFPSATSQNLKCTGHHVDSSIEALVDSFPFLQAH